MAADTTNAPRQVRWVYLGMPEARFYIGCRGHMHVFRRTGYRSGAFAEDGLMAKVSGPRVAAGVMVNGLTEAETSATASVSGLVGVVVDHAPCAATLAGCAPECGPHNRCVAPGTVPSQAQSLLKLRDKLNEIGSVKHLSAEGAFVATAKLEEARDMIAAMLNADGVAPTDEALRMLTRDQAEELWLKDCNRRASDDTPPYAVWAEAIVRKFCEVNDLPLPHGVDSSRGGHEK